MSEIKTDLYSVNKMLMGQMPPITKKEKLGLIDNINQMDDGEGRQYFMLLSNEERDYTVFNLCLGKEESLGEAVIECLDNRGSVTSFDVKKDEDGERIIAIELWIENKFYALFPYDLGVVEC